MRIVLETTGEREYTGDKEMQGVRKVSKEIMILYTDVLIMQAAMDGVVKAK